MSISYNTPHQIPNTKTSYCMSINYRCAFSGVLSYHQCHIVHSNSSIILFYRSAKIDELHDEKVRKIGVRTILFQRQNKY